METKSICVVVASYNESLRWMEWIPASWEKAIYCTSTARDSPLPPNTIQLPNVGREASQYLEHIVRRYDSLSDVTIFLQGFPFDHCPREVVSLLSGVQAFPHPFCYIGANPPDAKAINTPPFFAGARVILQKAHDLLPDKELSRGAPFSVGAQFYVKKEVIVARPRYYYERLLQAATEPDSWGYAHLLEPCWGHVFDWLPFSVVS